MRGAALRGSAWWSSIVRMTCPDAAVTKPTAGNDDQPRRFGVREADPEVATYLASADPSVRHGSRRAPCTLDEVCPPPPTEAVTRGSDRKASTRSAPFSDSTSALATAAGRLLEPGQVVTTTNDGLGRNGLGHPMSVVDCSSAPQQEAPSSATRGIHFTTFVRSVRDAERR
jgi:hypothetical protein